MSEIITVFTDGGSRGNPGPSACAFISYNAQGAIQEKRGKYIGFCTNNNAEYQGVIMALDYLVQFKKTLKRDLIIVNFYIDSRLVVSQLNGLFKVKDAGIRILIAKIREKENELSVPIRYNLIPREKNYLADNLVNQTLDRMC
jgi:ribonuclease HI